MLVEPSTTTVWYCRGVMWLAMIVVNSKVTSHRYVSGALLTNRHTALSQAFPTVSRSPRQADPRPPDGVAGTPLAISLGSTAVACAPGPSDRRPDRPGSRQSDRSRNPRSEEHTSELQSRQY